MNDDKPPYNLEQVRRLLTQEAITVTFGVSAYNEGASIVETLDSLRHGILELGLETSPILLSDSSSDGLTMYSAQEWKRTTGSNLVIQHSDTRRSLKEALNVILDNCDSDLLILTVGDVVIPKESLGRIVWTLLSPQRPDVAIGAPWPDPSFCGIRYRAGAWQLRVVQRLAAMSPTDEVRAEGALWGARREFYKNFRYPIGSGSIFDDVELMRAVVTGGYCGVNATSALVYKVPPGSLHDFCLTNRRTRFAVADQPHKRAWRDWLAFIRETSDDPIGALLYCLYRFYGVLFARKFMQGTDNEKWDSSITTKRVATDD